VGAWRWADKNGKASESFRGNVNPSRMLRGGGIKHTRVGGGKITFIKNVERWIFGEIKSCRNRERYNVKTRRDGREKWEV